VNTTPKPSATKNSSGELELLPVFEPDGAVAVELGLDVTVDIFQVDIDQLECPKGGVVVMRSDVGLIHGRSSVERRDDG
jgi:hypothetical protein